MIIQMSHMRYNKMSFTIFYKIDNSINNKLRDSIYNFFDDAMGALSNSGRVDRNLIFDEMHSND